jgi:hypothetical protein
LVCLALGLAAMAGQYTKGIHQLPAQTAVMEGILAATVVLAKLARLATA